MNIETANRLLQYRKQHKLSQEELAEKIGVSRQAVSKWERAEAAPDTDNLILLAELYGVSLDELLRGKTDEKENSDARDEQSAQDERAGMGGPDENKTYHKARKVSFRNGIHVESEDGDYVHINFKDGVNVIDHSGDRVHVGTDGIHVEENGSSRVYHLRLLRYLRRLGNGLDSFSHDPDLLFHLHFDTQALNQKNAG